LKSFAWARACGRGAFFFRQKHSGGFRLVAWTSELPQLKRLVYSILDTFPEEVEVLLKLREKEFDDRFSRYLGPVRRDKLIETMKVKEPFVFADGGSQLCVKRLDTDEFIALDDHGILFIYSDSPQFVDLCRRKGLKRQRRALIYAHDHWHIRRKDSVRVGRGLVKALGLELVD